MKPTLILGALSLSGLAAAVAWSLGSTTGPSPDGVRPSAGSSELAAVAAGGSVAQLSGSPAQGLPASEIAPAGGATRSAIEVALPTGHFGPAVPRGGRTATLSGFVRHASGGGSSLRFDAGPNRGVVVSCEADGSFTSPELYPGFGLVTVTSPAGASCTRELVLRHRLSTEFSLEFEERGLVTGTVVDRGGEPVLGARVSLDGREATVGADGAFSVPLCASGEPLLSVRAPGRVPYIERLHLPDEAALGRAVHVELEPATSLSISVPSIADSSEEALVYVFPSSGQRLSGRIPRAAYPWHELNPLRVAPGATLVIDELPVTRVDVLVSHSLARSLPAYAWTQAGESTHLSLELEMFPTLAGRVLCDGEPVVGASVRLEYANPMAATQGALGSAAKYYKSQPIEFVPQVRQERFTNEDGRFLLGLDPRAGDDAYLTITSPDGTLSITRAIAAGGLEFVDFDLANPDGRRRS